MLALTATDEARAALKALRERNPQLFERISGRIRELRGDPEPRAQGRAFRLGDGRTAHLAIHYDHSLGAELVLVWLVEEVGGVGTIKLVSLESAD